MGKFEKTFCAVLAVAMFGTAFYGMYYHHQHIVKYDCRLAEISVDYPQQVKEKCRRLQHGN